MQGNQILTFQITDKAEIRNWRWKKTNISIAWVDVQKLYDNVSCLLTIKATKLIGDSSNIVKLIKSNMNGWKITLVPSDKILGENSIFTSNLAPLFVLFDFYSFSHSIDISFEENRTRLLSRTRQEQGPLFTLHQWFKVSWH